MTTPYNPNQMGPMPGPSSSPVGRESAPSRRRNRMYLVITLLLALTGALVLLIGTSGGSADTYVLRAKQSIPALTRLSDDQFEATAITKDLVEEGAITGKSSKEAFSNADLENASAQYPINKGAQLTNTNISTSGGLDKNLAPDERLVAVKASVSRAAAGALRPGDRVDVVVVGDQSTPVSNVLLENVEIVAVSLAEDQLNAIASQQASDGSSNKNAAPNADVIPGIYTLRVKQNAVQPLTLADQLANIYLVYRTADGSAASGGPVTLLQALCVPAGGQTGLLPSVCAGVGR